MKQTVKKHSTTKRPIKVAVQRRRKKAVHHAKQLVVPRARNQYRPHLVRSSGLIVVMLLVLAVQMIYNFSSGGTVLGGQSNMTTERLLTLTNQERDKKQQSRLEFNGKLAAAAALKADDMIAHNYWAHTGPDGATPWQWFEQANYSYGYAGENLAKDFTSAESVVAAWMSSPEHRKNILNGHYDDVGFAVTSGVLDGRTTTLIVAMYGSPKTNATLATQPAVLAATDDNQSIMAKFGAHLQLMTPIALSSVILLLVMAAIAGVAHLYRKRLPKPIQSSWRRHHGLYKAIGMSCLAVVFIALYGGGQI